MRHAALTLLTLLLPLVAVAQGPVFPEVLEVEHRFVQAEADGSVFQGEPVVDHYGGNWIISERRDGSRLTLDFARRELIEVDPVRGTHSSLSFARWAELRRRYAEATGPVVSKRGEDGDEKPGELQVSQLRMAQRPSGLAEGLQPEGIRVARSGEAAVELWVDRRFRLSPRALDALAELDRLLESPVAEHLAAGRAHVDGAFVVSTRRPLALDRADSGYQGDEVLRLERRKRLPLDLLAVPEGSRRVPHRLESLVAWAEEEARIDHLMSGAGR